MFASRDLVSMLLAARPELELLGLLTLLLWTEALVILVDCGVVGATATGVVLVVLEMGILTE